MFQNLINALVSVIESACNTTRKRFRAYSKQRTKIRNGMVLRVERLESREVPATFFWIGADLASPTLASDRFNWAKDDGTATPPVGIASPGAGDTAVYRSNNSNPCTFDGGAATSLASINIQAGYTSTITLSHNLMVTSSMTMASGTVDAGSNTLSIGNTVGGGIAELYTASFTWNGGTITGGANTGLFIGDGSSLTLQG